MSISDNYAPNATQGNGATVTFTGSWSPIAASYMRVYKQLRSTGDLGTALVQGAGAGQYTLSFTSSGYSITLGTAPSSLYNIVRAREVALDQTDPYTTARGFQGATIENSFDKITAIAQDLRDDLDRSPAFQVGSSQTNVTITELVDDELLFFNEADNTLESSGITVTELNAAIGAAAGGSTGTGSVVRQTGATIISPLINSANLTTPALGTPGSGLLTNCTGLPLATGIADIAWTTYTPTITSGAGTLTTKSATGRHKVIGKTCFFQMAITITTNGTGSSFIAASLPFTPAAFEYECSARNSSSPYIQMAYIPASTPAVIVLKLDGTYPAIDGTVLQVSGAYEIV